MKPYKFEPYLKTTIWGGYQIAPFKGIFNAQPNVGESWEISGVPGHESVAINRGLVNDVDEGLTLVELIDKYKELLVGKKIYKKFGNQFPLLVKLIDSGLKKSITPEEYEQLATAEPQNGRSPMQDVIATHEAHEGDLYFLPAGRLHAIGAGNFLAEIQQTSDITYRVYDFGRKDVHGNPRELHIEEAKAAIDYQVWPAYRTSYDSTKPTSQLINCPYFVVHRVVVQVAQQIDFHCDSFVIVVCLWGKANINGIEIRQGETILVPACENILYIFGNATFLTATM